MDTQETREASSAFDVPPDGKLGLALSGGGFRAALFHIGVLARMAELDLLRRVEQLSTVSGGAIVGAYYYLKVKELLEEKRKDGLTASTPGAYVTIVREIEAHFLAAVQKNLRWRALRSAAKNARMLVSDDYSRSDRMAEMYQKNLYKIFSHMFGGDEKRILLEKIKIEPKGHESETPAAYNKTSEYKIPILTLNATSLNTGHAWRFTSFHVGEPPCEDSIDTNFRLGYLRFDGDYSEESEPPLPPQRPDAAERRQKQLHGFTLADAVAASSAVPAIFAPFSLHDLYWNSQGEEIVVELADGGVFDNQGLDALFEADCKYIICSDASGQLEDVRAPSSWFGAVLLRANDIFMTRVRDSGYEKLCDKAEEKEIADFRFFHLRDEFDALADFPVVPGPNNKSDDAKKNGHVYRLSNLRTDLDTFTDVEAFTLMYDGYCLGDSRLSNNSKQLSFVKNPPQARWGFLAIRDVLAKDSTRVWDHLVTGKNRTFKLFCLWSLLYPVAFKAGAGAAGALGLALVWWLSGGIMAAVACVFRWPPSAFVVKAVVIGLLVAAIGKMLEETALIKMLTDRVRPYRRTWSEHKNWLVCLALPIGWIGAAAAHIVLNVIDPLFKKAGRIP